MTAASSDAARVARPIAGAPARSAVEDDRPSAILFYAFILYLILEYLRPPVLSQLKFQLLFVVAMPIVYALGRQKVSSPILGVQLAILGQTALSIFHANNYFSAYEATRTLWANMVAALAIVWLLPRMPELSRAIWVWALIMAYQAVFALTIGGGGGNAGFLGDENDLALGLVTAIPFMFTGMQQFRGWRRLLSLGLLVLLVAGVVRSDSRGGFVALAAVVGYILVYSPNRLRNFTLIAMGALVFYFSLPDSYKKEIESISDTTGGTAEARLFLWAAATNMWIENPIWGVGAMNSIWLIGEYQPEAGNGPDELFSDGNYTERNWSGTALHSVYFEVLSETGLVGVGLFIALCTLHFRAIQRARSAVKRARYVDRDLRRDAELYGIAIGGALVGYLVAGAFLSLLFYPYLFYFTAFAAAYESMVMRRLAAARQRAGVMDPRATPPDRRSPGQAAEGKDERRGDRGGAGQGEAGPSASLGAFVSGRDGGSGRERGESGRANAGLSSLLTGRRGGGDDRR